MELKTYQNDRLSLSYVETGSGAPLHFGHANGFAPGVYEPLLQRLARKHKVYGLNICSQARCAPTCADKPGKVDSWFQLADELTAFLKDVVREPVVGVGHSVGGTATLFAAVKNPELFTKIILLDPTLLWPKVIWLVRIMNLLGQRSKMPLAQRARKRRDGWASRDEAYEYFRKKELFMNWDEQALRAYVKVGLVDAPEGGVRLACPPELEAQVFESYPSSVWSWVKRLKMPVTIVRGAESDTLVPQAWEIFRRMQPKATMIELPGGRHLFPLEKPAETAQIILQNSRF